MKKPFLKCKYKELRIISDKAIVVKCYNGDSAVLPKSQVHQNLADDSVLVPVWLAEQKTLQFSAKQVWLDVGGPDSNSSPAPAPKATTCSNLKAVVAALTAAKGRLKWPKVRFDDADIKLSVAGDRAKVPGSINVTTNAGFGDAVWYGRILDDGTFQPSAKATQAVEDFLDTLAADFHGAVKANGKNTGNCCFCRKPLTDDASVAVGYGPVCAKNYDLPH